MARRLQIEAEKNRRCADGLPLTSPIGRYHFKRAIFFDSCAEKLEEAEEFFSAVLAELERRRKR